MSDFSLSEPGVIQAQILQDQNGEWGLYIVPANSEICITEAELRAALKEMKE